MTTDASSNGIDGSQRNLTPESFGRWMGTAGFSAKTVSARRAAMKALAAVWQEALTTPAAEYVGHPGYLDGLSRIAGWQADEAKAFPRLLAMMEEDTRLLALNRPFNFYEVNPGISALGFGAELAGGHSRGATMIHRLAKHLHRDFQGSDAVGEPHGSYSVVLVDLPFSVFATRGGGDPGVNEVLAEAAKRSHRAKAVLFRMDWAAGARMGLDPEAITKLVEARLSGFTAKSTVAANERFVPMKGHELFIAAARHWTADFRMVGDGREIAQASDFVLNHFRPEDFAVPGNVKGNVFPRFIARRIGSDYRHDPRAAIVKYGKRGQRMLTPLEIMMILGFPENYRGYAGNVELYPLLGECVPVPVAERAVRGLLRAAGLE